MKTLIFLKITAVLILLSFLIKSNVKNRLTVIDNEKASINNNIKLLPSKKENFFLFLLIGQSNMAGRGIVDVQDTLKNPRILTLNKNNEWVIAKEPLHFDKPKIAGVGPGLSFAREILSYLPADVKIGLIPCACGGSPIRVWNPGQFWEQTNSYPYDNTVARTKYAIQDGTLKGILWHQGESDKNPESIKIYKSNLIQLVNALRNEFNTAEIPFIAGEIGSFHQNSYTFNHILHVAKDDITFYDVVSSIGLYHKGDFKHFDTPSQHILGKRYANKMKQLLKL